MRSRRCGRVPSSNFAKANSLTVSSRVHLLDDLREASALEIEHSRKEIFGETLRRREGSERIAGARAAALLAPPCLRGCNARRRDGTTSERANRSTLDCKVGASTAVATAPPQEDRHCRRQSIPSSPTQHITNTHAVGHESLASALSNFSSRWRPGVQQLTQDGQKFAGELSASALAYQAVEQRIAQALNGTG